MGGKMSAQRVQQWVEAQKRFHLSPAHAQMARELGMNPRKLGKLANHKQEPWKAPLPVFIEQIYSKRFGRSRPEVVMSIEERVRLQKKKGAAKKAAKAARKSAQLQAPGQLQSPDETSPF